MRYRSRFQVAHESQNQNGNVNISVSGYSCASTQIQNETQSEKQHDHVHSSHFGRRNFSAQKRNASNNTNKNSNIRESTLTTNNNYSSQSCLCPSQSDLTPVQNANQLQNQNVGENPAGEVTLNNICIRIPPTEGHIFI